MSERPIRILLVHPGASWSTCDVYDGLLHGLRTHGAIVEQYRLDTRIPWSVHALRTYWELRKEGEPDLPEPNNHDFMYHAGVGALEMAMRLNADVVLIVSGMLLHPDVVGMMKRAGLRVVCLFTESPYDELKELRYAELLDGGWTNERTSVKHFRLVNPNIGYLPHAWHPLKHYVSSRMNPDLPSHDVVFVGSGFPERIAFFNAIDWTGIDLGLYGNWDPELGLNEQAQACVRSEPISNETASALYRRAKIGLNLYRLYKGSIATRDVEKVTGAESLSPRAYELAACGAFHLSEHRAEVAEKFGALVPTFSNATEAEALMRAWLPKDAERARIAQQLPYAVAQDSWVDRAAVVLTDLKQLYLQAA